MNQSPTFDLAATAFERLKVKLASHGSGLSHSAGCSILSLLETMEKGLAGQLSPSFHLASIDPGIGKTLAVAEFLKVWWEQGCPGGEGILIGVSRLSEIATYIEASGVPRELFAVFTSSAEHNATGVKSTGLDTAPILFTTQQMIASRVRGKLFRDASEFHFRGQPRRLRVWDESLIPAQPLVVGRDELGLLLSLRLPHRESVEAVDALMATIEEASDGDIVEVPASFALAAKRMGRGGVETAVGKELLLTLGQLAGRQALVVDDGGMGKALVAVGEKLPEDFAPVIILDASGRVRSTYDFWFQQRGDLVRLPRAVSDYRKLEVNLWLRATGKHVMRDPTVREEVIQGVADAINQDATSDWLVVHYKEDERFGEDLRSRVAMNGHRVRCIHWGNHHGTNEFRDIPNVALVGQPTYRRSDYLALGLAVGLPFEDLANAERNIRAGERAHNLLQATCRGAVRNVIGGFAGHCRLFLIATPSPALAALLHETFPGCSIREWNAKSPLKGKVKLAAEYLLDQFSDPATVRVRKKHVAAAAEIATSATFAGYIMKSAALREFMNRHCIDERGQYFERVEFEPVDEGYVYEPPSEPTQL